MIKRECNKLTNHITYNIMDNVIYLYLSDDIADKEFFLMFKRLKDLLEEKEVMCININGKNLENNKKFYSLYGFRFLNYDVNKLNTLFKGYKDKKSYKCYATMKYNDFLDVYEEHLEKIRKVNMENGFVYNITLLFLGIGLLCYFVIQGAIYLVK